MGQRTLLPSAPRRERPLPLSPNYTILLTCALMGFLCVYDLPSHDFLAMTGFRPSGFPPRSYPCAYSADRMGHCTPFLLGNHLTVSGSDDRRAASSDSHILFSRINLVFVGNDRIEIRTWAFVNLTHLRYRSSSNRLYYIDTSRKSQ